MTLVAGRDLSLTTAQDVSIERHRTGSDYEWTYQLAQDRTVLLAERGAITISAGRDGVLTGAALTAGGDVDVHAGRNLTLDAANDAATFERRHGRRTDRTYDERAQGTAIQAGGAVRIEALGTVAADDTAPTGQLVTRGASVQAGGAVTVRGKDVQLADAREVHEVVTTDSWKKKGFFSSKTVTTRDETRQDLSIGSLVSGSTVDVESAGSILVQGSHIVGDGAVALRAQGDVTIAAGEDRFTEHHDRVETRRGWLGGNGGIGFTIGTRRKEVTTEVDGVSHLRDGGDGETVTTASSIGSVSGALTIDAGGRLDARGSDLTAAGDIALAGQTVLLDAVYDVTRTHQTTVITQSGFTAALSSGALDAGVTLYNTIHRANEVQDDRLKALYALRALRQAQVAADAMKALAQNKGDSRSLKISIGNTHSESRAESTTISSTALGSSIVGGGHVSIVARGDPAQARGDLAIVGSTVEGGSVTLDAARDLLFRSAENRLDTSNDSLSWSVTAGVGVTVGQGKAAAGFQASGSIQASQDDAHDRTFTETTIRSAGAVILRSGRDTTLRGATVSGGSIAADVGRDLLLESQQDSSTYHSTDLSASGQATKPSSQPRRPTWHDFRRSSRARSSCWRRWTSS